MPHPAGFIRVHFVRKEGGGVAGEVELPAGVSGEFYWGGREMRLHGGRQEVRL
jgi:hypothetical protein